jgi:acyl carrier protein
MKTKDIANLTSRAAAKLIISDQLVAPDWTRTLAGNGADSLLANEIRMDLEDHFEIEIPADWLYQDTLETLVEKIAAMEASV